MLIILDTCIVCSDFQMKNPLFDLVFRYLEKDCHSKLLFLKIVVDEIINKYKESNNDINKHFKNKHFCNESELQKIKLNIKDLIDNDIANYIDFLNHTLKYNQGIQAIDYPKTEHKKIIERSLLRKKPFDGEGHNGYRDVIIWENVLEVAVNNPFETIYFITKNTNDFSSKSNKKNLHSDLQSELTEKSISNVVYFTSLHDFIKEIITPSYEAVENVGDEFSDILYNSDKRQIISDAIDKLTLDGFINFPNIYETISLKYLEDIYSTQIDDVVKISNNEFFVSTIIEMSCSFDFYIHKSNLYEDNPLYEIDDSNWNEYYITAYETVDIIADISFWYNNNDKEVTSCEVNEINIKR